MMRRFPLVRQLDSRDCGPACLCMIAAHHGKTYSLQTLREFAHITRLGVSLLGISEAAEKIGYRTMGVKITWQQLLNDASLPCIVHWNQKHFVVVYKVTPTRVYVADPALGKIVYSKAEFLKGWGQTVNDNESQGLALLIEATPDFYSQQGEKVNRNSFLFLLRYLKPHRRLIWQLLFGMLAGSLLLLVFPFLTQAVVDIGIADQDIGFIYLIMVAQFALLIGRTALDFLRSWILLHMSTRINVSLIADYLIKLMRLPIRYFDTRLSGDILQRVGDHSRIEHFLTQSSLSIVFAVFNLLVFTVVLAIYHIPILLVFLIGSLLYFLWIWAFMRKRRELDLRRFLLMSDNQNSIIQLVSCMQEIKLNNCERSKRWEWEQIQARIFKIKAKSLALQQYQQVGSVLLNESKNILITVMAALAVVQGDMQLGVMFAVQFIIGQLNGPIDQMVGFLHSSQDAKISLERLSEVHAQQDENQANANKSTDLLTELGFQIRNLVFQYEGPHSDKVINDLNVDVPARKVTAIVGTSGSGKTTLVKLLLGFYNPVEGAIRLNGVDLSLFSSATFRERCGIVMQDGYIFSDTIANNIALSDEAVDRNRLIHACNVANATEFIDRLPLRFNTRVGNDGLGLSQGQKQRLLIARAIYKNPDILFFDEATNSLDANNENVIMKNLAGYFVGRTVLIVAHRLSTVVNADQILVLEQGRLVQQGTHQELIKDAEGAYYQLIKNQLELGA